METSGPDYLTTKELAELLRIKERKVYDLASNGEIPCVRAVGKLLFPAGEIAAWMGAARSGPQVEDERRPLVLAGSHDPLLDWALRQSGSGLAAFFDGSCDGLERFANREAMACGLHLRGTDGSWNVDAVAKRFSRDPVVLIEWARRECGLIVASGNPKAIAGLSDLPALRVARRQAGAGGSVHFEALLFEAGLDFEILDGPEALARTEDDLARLVMEERADAAFGLRAVAAQFRLGFVPLAEDRFDLLVGRKAYFEPSFQRLTGFMRSPEFAERARTMAGYDVSRTGMVHFNGGGR
ncbi:DNA-binding protein, excisionase family [Fulvimarina pelagi HTCC2506]|uniref:DNA-binding protein, excisionase family n=1 Tax=Fulvimarina pelagi HTCC2506 TaxID=314231 RepID=Q0G137_9HYPH|nr:helix-turn-helix transcriptional regulator [Fulvimarina pelagi]EAU40802.1 DNA-binding protein, excisionase family [Fulvimarina pelagi HTCC2506]